MRSNDILMHFFDLYALLQNLSIYQPQLSVLVILLHTEFLILLLLSKFRYISFLRICKVHIFYTPILLVFRFCWFQRLKIFKQFTSSTDFQTSMKIIILTNVGNYVKTKKTLFINRFYFVWIKLKAILFHLHSFSFICSIRSFCGDHRWFHR